MQLLVIVVQQRTEDCWGRIEEAWEDLEERRGYLCDQELDGSIVCVDHDGSTVITLSCTEPDD